MDAIPSETDVLVVGAGPGGYTGAIRAAQLGLDVLLVERDAWGGTCLNHGCIPSKALLSATRPVHELADSEHMGIYAEPYVDVTELAAWRDDVVGTLTDGVESLCRSSGVTLVDGRAAFEGPTVARVETDEGATAVDFEHAIVATGSRPVELPGFDFGARPVFDSRQALDRPGVPDRLVVVGAGYIGMELATVFARLGTAVTVVEVLDSVMPAFPAHLVEPVRRRLDDLDVDVHLGEAATGWSRTDDGVVVRTETDAGTREHGCDAVLVAVGREPVTGTVAPEAAGLTPTDDGFLETDAYGRTDVDSIFAVGDVAGEPMLAHRATAEAVAAAETIAGEPTPAPAPDAVPSVVFTDPEIATVGLTREEAGERGDEPVVGRFPFESSGRALAADATAGFVEVVADADGHVVGGHVVGEEASELVGELVVAVRADLTLADLAGAVHPHPTRSEAVMGAAEHALGRAIHTRNDRPPRNG